MTKKNRLLALMLSLTLLMFMLFSVCFMIAEAGHDCTGEDCPICYQFNACENTMKSIGQSVPMAVLAVFVWLFAFSLPSFTRKMSFNTSLVTLKVKLSD